MKNSIEFEIALPKGIRLKDIRVNAIQLDDKWETTVRENHKNIDRLPLGVARRKYG
jgi:hypothetical protein